MLSLEWGLDTTTLQEVTTLSLERGLEEKIMGVKMLSLEGGLDIRTKVEIPTFLSGPILGGKAFSGSSNVYIGSSAGLSNKTGSHNIFIGYYAGYTADDDESNKFSLGSSTSMRWLTGDITSTGHLYVNNNKVLTVASTEFTQAQSNIATNLAALQSTHPHNFASPHGHPYARSEHGHRRLHIHHPGNGPFMSSQTLKKNIKPFN